MPDFAQPGDITTFHRIGGRTLGDLESDLSLWSRSRPATLILPCLQSELDGPAMPRIVAELRDAHYVDEIVIGLDAATEAEFEQAREFFAPLPQAHHILWNDGPGLRAVHEHLAALGLAPSSLGKGRNVWYCIGYALARGRSQVIAMHDCDIVTYERELLARLLYPVMAPHFGYHFNKGFYHRVMADPAGGPGRFGGRVTRLFVAPMLAALGQVSGDNEYLRFIRTFRYPLAGEYALTSELAAQLRLPVDWGLEIGMLGEIDRLCGRDEVAQTDLAAVFDHKHQRLSPDDPTRGLHKMSIDITKAFLRGMPHAADRAALDSLDEIVDCYRELGADAVRRHSHDALLNGYSPPVDDELAMVEVFAKAIIEARDELGEFGIDADAMAPWSAVVAAAPDIGERLLAAVD